MSEFVGGTIQLSGTPVTLTNEACSGATTAWQITNAAKRALDPETAVVVKDNGVTVSASDYTLDRFFGRITFTSAKTGPITISGKYLPLTPVAYSKSAQVKLARTMHDGTRLSDEFQRTIPGKRECTVTLGVTEPLFTDLGDGRTLSDLLESGDPLLIEVVYGLESAHALRCWAVIGDASIDLSSTDLAGASLTFESHPIEAIDGTALLYSRV